MRQHLYILHLPWDKPLLTANQRLHWRKERELKKELRDTTYQLAKYHNLPKNIPHAEIHIVYTPAVNRRRDPSNIWPSQKAIIDGLVKYGLVFDDNPVFVTEKTPQIDPVDKAKRRSRIRVEITAYLTEKK